MTSPFNPQEHLIKLPKRVKDPETGQWVTRYDDYLEVKWRLCWFRNRYPHGRIETEEVCVDLDRLVTIDVVSTVDGKRQTQHKTGTGYARFKARVEDGEGGVATGYGTENAAGFADFVERAETRSIGRALAGLGIGTQFVGAELSEGEHIVDATVTTTVAAATNGNSHTPAPEPDASLERPTESHLAALRTLALTECGEDLEVYEQRIRTTMGLRPQASVSPRLLTRTQTMAQYMDLFAYYKRLESQLAKSRKETRANAPQDAPAPPAEAAAPQLLEQEALAISEADLEAAIDTRIAETTAPAVETPAQAHAAFVERAEARAASRAATEKPPADPQPAVPPSPGELSSAPAPEPEAVVDTVDSLVAEAITWGLKEDVTRRVITLHKDLAKCRRILQDAAERNKRQVA